MHIHVAAALLTGRLVLLFACEVGGVYMLNHTVDMAVLCRNWQD
jgi:hypothetical protein